MNDLLFTQPRQGIDAERNVGNARIVATASIGEFHGAAYGGRPIPTGESTYASQPEVGLFYNQRIASGLSVGGEELDGVRNITLTGRTAFTDSYRRSGLYASYEGDRFDVLAQQWWGKDVNADGAGTSLGSSGGYVRLRAWPFPWHHAFVGVRYDASANPAISRDYVFYAGLLALPNARIVVQRVQPLGGRPGAFGGALTLGLPWPVHYSK
ncbi:MAG: hypothetical protein JO101_12665 [Candidatus Eremiobacteraeota bacterium]|nr:hypothetical protein [Candidatus Eremiobacteraeota bacterium]